jgi:phosphoglycolate phosphatase
MTDISTTTIDAVCWDWNGTLLDDVGVARAAMDLVLAGRGLPGFVDEAAYRRVFGFPIRDFYERVGIGGVDFVAAADEYLARFAVGVETASLHPDALQTLEAVDALGVEQVLISATPEAVLERQLAPHALTRHFSGVHGLTDVYHASKEQVVGSWLAASGHRPSRVVMVGDTNHDEEIAELLGVRFVRFRKGHQEPPAHGRHPVIDGLSELVPELTRDPGD